MSCFVRSQVSQFTQRGFTQARMQTRCNGFDVAEGFPMECQNHQNVVVNLRDFQMFLKNYKLVKI